MNASLRVTTSTGWVKEGNGVEIGGGHWTEECEDVYTGKEENEGV